MTEQLALTEEDLGVPACSDESDRTCPFTTTEAGRQLCYDLVEPFALTGALPEEVIASLLRDAKGCHLRAIGLVAGEPKSLQTGVATEVQIGGEQ